MERLAPYTTRAPVAAHALRQYADGRVEIDTPPDPKTESTVPVLDRLDVFLEASEGAPRRQTQV